MKTLMALVLLGGTVAFGQIGNCINAHNANYTVTSADMGCKVTTAISATYTVPKAGTPGFEYRKNVILANVAADNSGIVLTVNVQSGVLIGYPFTGSTAKLAPGQAILLSSDAPDWRVLSYTLGGGSTGGSMVFPSAGVAQTDGISWLTSLQLGTGSGNLPQLDSGGKLMPAILPLPGTTTLGGVKSATCASGSHFSSIDVSTGLPVCTVDAGSGGGGTGNAATFVSVTPATNITLTASSNTVTSFLVNLNSTAISTSTLAGATAGQAIFVRVCQDSTGSRTFPWPSNFVGAGTVEPTASACSNQAFVLDNSGNVNAVGAMFVTGVSGSQLTLYGSTSGYVHIKPTAIAGNWDFVIPGAACASHQWWNLTTCAQPAIADISGKIKTCTVIIGDPGAASSALADDNDSPSACVNDTGVDWTITSVSCYANAGSPTVTPILTGGTGTSVLSGALTCGTATWAAGTLSGTPVVHSFSGATCSTTPCSIDVNIATAGGSAKYLVVKIVGTY